MAKIKKKINRLQANVTDKFMQEINKRIKELDTNQSRYIQDLIRTDLSEDNTLALKSKIDQQERAIIALKKHIEDNYYNVSLLTKFKRIFADPKQDLEEFERILLLTHKP